MKNIYPDHDIKTFEKGINTLIELGFLTQVPNTKNLYYFDDIPMKYRVKTAQEYEEMKQLSAEEAYVQVHKDKLQEYLDELDKPPEQKKYSWM